MRFLPLLMGRWTQALPPPQSKMTPNPDECARDVLEAKLVGHVGDHIRCASSRVRDNFFEIGGHSFWRASDRANSAGVQANNQAFDILPATHHQTVANLLRARTTVPSISPLAALQAQGSLPRSSRALALSDAAIFSNLARSMPATGRSTDSRHLSFRVGGRVSSMKAMQESTLTR